VAKVPISDKLLTVKDIAKKLNVSLQTVRNYIKEGKIKAYKFDNVWRIPSKEVDKFLEDRMTK
jgi:excisionase family DNA binding protein